MYYCKLIYLECETQFSLQNSIVATLFTKKKGTITI